ncbi:glycosyltransferase-like protein gnt13 [Leptopilina heterotoma]|uniref:glycosyltransferase-like protein gnt13 n=1 Tax=Leptopilina heterotoma TaxID=63436 RepID=UPI001CA94BE4|nr:glycosyltransferase-like protein gnt13 [Leptopilina heterotoma]
MEMEDENIEVRIKLDDISFTAIFAEGETISLSKNSLKNDWDDLAREYKEAEKLSKPLNHDVQGTGEFDSSDHSHDVSHTNDKQSLSETQVVSQVNNLIGDIDNNSGVSPGIDQGVPSSNKSCQHCFDKEKDSISTESKQSVLISNDSLIDKNNEETNTLTNKDSNEILITNDSHLKETNSNNTNDKLTNNDKDDSNHNSDDSDKNNNQTQDNNKGAIKKRQL